MKATTLLLAALIISISAGTALADRGNHQHDKIVTKRPTIVKHQPVCEQHKSCKAQAQHHKGYPQPIIRHEGNRARIAQIIRAKQLQQHNRQLAAQVQFCNQQRHEQLRSSTVILPLPIPRVALFFPW